MGSTANKRHGSPATFETYPNAPSKGSLPLGL